MRATTMATILLASMMLLQGCATSTQPEPSASGVTESSAAETTPDADGYGARVVHEDADETVMLLDHEQVSLAAGEPIAADSIDSILSTLADADVWVADAATQPHAQVIADAFSVERDRAGGVLRAMLNNPEAQLKLYVRHAGGESFARVEVGN